MAIRAIAKITLYEHLDQDKIDLLLSGTDTITLDIERQYDIYDVPQYLGSVISTDFTTSGIDYLQGLKDVLDVATYKHEDSVVVWKVKYDESAKEFDLTDSFVRDQVDTSGSKTAVTYGQLLKAVFQTPGFDGPVQTIIDLPYGDAISSGDKAALLDVGIELDLTVTGDLFSVKTQSVPYKVAFYRPDTAAEKYVIDFSLTNQIIEI